MEPRRVGPSLSDLVADEPRVAVVGPVRPGEAGAMDGSKRLREAEEKEWRALKEAKKDDGGGREEWMTMVPEGRRQDPLELFRGGKKQFSSSDVSDGGKASSLSWTTVEGSGGDASVGVGGGGGEEMRRKKMDDEVKRRKAEEESRQVRAMMVQKSLMEIHEEEEEKKRKKQQDSDDSDDSDSSDDDKKNKKKKDKKKSKNKKKKEKKKKKKEKKMKKEGVVVTHTLGAMRVGTWDRDEAMRGGSSKSVAEQKASLDRMRQQIGPSGLQSRFGSGH